MCCLLAQQNIKWGLGHVNGSVFGQANLLILLAEVTIGIGGVASRYQHAGTS